MRRILGSLAVMSAAALTAAGAVSAQPFPSKRITLVVPYPAGGPTDVTARQVGEHMSRTLGQPVIIENVAGAGGSTGSGRVAKAAPDGYTLLVHQLGLAITPALYPNLAFNPATDMDPVGMIHQGPIVVVAKTDVPNKPLTAFQAWAKEPGRRVKIAHPGVGTIGHLCGVILASSLGFEADHVAYRGGGPALNDIVAGHVDVHCASMTIGVAQIKAGTVKAIGVTSAEPSKVLPDVPSLSSIGLGGKDLHISFWHLLLAPKGIPAEAMQKLNAALGKALEDPKLNADFATAGVEVFPKSERSPEWAKKFFNSEIERWSGVVKKNNIVPN
jgi:tripartite-type tricarboxylate transporter receptor subunit TctC